MGNTVVSPTSPGRGYLWAGLLICLLGPLLVIAQFSLKVVGVPWYSPAMATLGVVLLLIAIARRLTSPRVIGLVFVGALAGLQWFFFGSLSKLPEYTGPAQAGKPLPAFQATLADGRLFTEANLQDGSRHVVAFYRGRW